MMAAHAGHDAMVRTLLGVKKNLNLDGKDVVC